MKLEKREKVRVCHEQLNHGELERTLELIAEDALNHGIKVVTEGYKMVLEDLCATFLN